MYVDFSCLIYNQNPTGFLIPFFFYISERTYRHFRAERKLEISTVIKMGDTLVLEFEKGDEKRPFIHAEGQYILLNCPHVCKYQWHPYAITSAPESKSGSLHLVVQQPGSWSAEVYEYFKILSPQETKSTLYQLRQDGSKGGMIIGPDGQTLLRAYGPLYSPSQNVTDYEVSVVVGSGSAVDSLSSTLQQVAHFLMKFGLGVVFPSHAYFYWIVKYSEIKQYRWMIRNIKSESCFTMR
jgi:hypothetical protein